MADRNRGGCTNSKTGGWAGRARWLSRVLVCVGPWISQVAEEDPSRETIRQIEDRLEHARPETRSYGVRLAADLDWPRAWGWVLAALEDGESEVSDTAQLRLAGVSSPESLKLLVGKAGLGHRDRVVRLRVAEALGRVGVDVDGSDLTRALKRSDPDLSRRILWSLERLERGGHLVGDRAQIGRRVEALLGRGHPERVRADALAALARVHPPKALRHLRMALESKQHSQLRTAAVVLLGERLVDPLPDVVSSAEVMAAMAVASRDPEGCVRQAAYRILGRAPRVQELELLIQRLEEEDQRHLRLLLAHILRRASGRGHSDDPRPWRDWLSRLDRDWSSSSGDTPTSQQPQTRVAKTLANLRPSTDRVTILVDLSGSVWMEREGGVSRKQLLDVELRALLEGLPRTVFFNLIPYATRQDPWGKQQVQATPKAVRQAWEEFDSCRLSGRGDVWSAVQVALEDPGLGSLLVVTDGMPTGGEHALMDLLVPLMEWECRWRGIAVDSVLIDSSKRLQRYWSDLAQRTGGSMTPVHFETDVIR